LAKKKARRKKTEKEYSFEATFKPLNPLDSSVSGKVSKKETEIAEAKGLLDQDLRKVKNPATRRLIQRMRR